MSYLHTYSLICDSLSIPDLRWNNNARFTQEAGILPQHRVKRFAG
jgi:hypothetical protein